eukprot:Blabericola_migrator_1__8241@NODE_426_length_8602_cov_18_656825_g336_i0_p1_GENE_NODE_426_length_8602_cov_18_656825_g336_i0NODE_426_length_8602_cov_18_656825_g336_i0_p1_ORF_typecomplete_len1158_score173_20_NODE_426_length_8602_cov_18_656825_g336_i045177990
MSGSRRCILQHYNKCQTTSTARTFGFGICCVLGMYGVADPADNEAHLGPIPANSREDIHNAAKYCQAPISSPLYGTDGAWHKRAQMLLAQVLKAGDQGSTQPDVWNQVTEVLGEAENILQTRCLSDDEVETVNQIAMVAVKSAPLYPCVSQCSKLWYEIRASAERAQGLPHNASTTPSEQRPLVAFEPGAAIPSEPVSSRGLDVSHDSESDRYFHEPSQPETSMMFHRPPLEFRTHPSGSPGRCAFPAESLLSEETLAQGKADLTNQAHPAILPPPAEELVERDLVVSWEIGHNDAVQQNLKLVEEHVAKLIADLNYAHRSAGTSSGSPRLISVKQRLKFLCRSLSHLNNQLPTLNAHMLSTLSIIRSLLMFAKAEVKISPWVRMPNRSMTMFNTAILKLSHLWHQARIANLKTGEKWRRHELESLREVISFPREFSPIRCVASTTYATLLTAVSDKEAREAVHNFLTFCDLTSRSIDLTTAKLHLLILLYLKHENVKLSKIGVQKLLDKLISKLRGEIFGGEKTEISICHIPEFKEFCLAYFGVRPHQGLDWRDSLRVNHPLIRNGQRPIIVKLFEYGSSFRNGVNELKRLITSASLASNKKEVYARQVESLEAFRRHLLSIDSPTSVFADGQTLAYLKQFVAFAKTRLNECEVDGHATCRKQVRVLEVTLECLQWCRLLSSYLEAPSPSLEETYDMVAHALILDSLWSSEMTASLLDSERTFISQGTLSALRSNNVHDELLVCVKMFLDRNVPSRFVEICLDELLLFRAQRTSDYDKMVTLLASECRMDLFRLQLVSDSNMPSSTKKVFAEALVQARLAAKRIHMLPVPDQSLSPSLRERFVAPPAHEAPQLLSLDVVLKEALKGINSDHLTVREVARHVATYLLDDFVDEQWLNFFTCQVDWCSFTPQQLAERQVELMTLVQNFGTLLKTFWFKARWVKPLNVSAEATPDLVRHFVHTATLKWLVSKLRRNSACPAEEWQSLCKVAGDYAFAWMPKWMAFMYNSRVLFPSNVIVDADSFTRLCVDVSRQMYFKAPPEAQVGVKLDKYEVSARLRHLLKGVAFGILTRQDFEALLEPHQSQFVSKWNSRAFLTLLLYAWHDNALPADKRVLEECIKIVANEGASLIRDVGMTVSTLRNCIVKLLTLKFCDELDPA